MRRHLILCAAMACAAFSSAANAETVEEVAARFGARESVLDISLAPSGSKIAYIAPGGPSAEVLYVVDLAGEGRPKAILNAQETNSELDYCEWATDERLICKLTIMVDDPTGKIPFSRLFAISADGQETVMLSQEAGSRALGIMQYGGSVIALDLDDKPDRVLMTRQWVEEKTTGSRVTGPGSGLGVEEVNVLSGKRRRVESPDDRAVGYYADEHGDVRLKLQQPPDNNGYAGDTVIYYYRKQGSDNWKELSRAEVTGQGLSGFTPVAVDAELDVAFGFDDLDGHQALYSIALDGSDERKLLLAREDADVDTLITIGRQRRVVGASYATEKRQVEYTDSYLAGLAQQLRTALPGRPQIDIVDASTDEQQLLIIAASDTDPGMLYLFDKGSSQLSEVLPLRQELAGQTMGNMKPVSFPAADGTMIPGYLTLPPDLPAKGMKAIVLPHGGPSSRDEWGFDWLVQFFVARGYAVLQPNYRGSTGYGSDWFGRNGFQAWKTAIGDVDDAGHWLVEQGIADPEKLAIVGWSYGGYAALQSQVVAPDLYKAVVAIAPVTDLERLANDQRHYMSYSLTKDFVGSGPHIEEGSPARNAERFVAPVILFHGTDDNNVDVGQSRLMEERLQQAGKQVEYLEFDGLAHSLDDTAARTTMLAKIDGFLAGALGE